MAARPLGKDFQNQQGAVIDRQADVPLQIALLCRTEGLVKQHLPCAMHHGQFLDFIGLAAAYKQRRVGCLAFAGQAGDRMQPARLGQQTELNQAIVKMGQPKINADQKGRRWGGGRGICQSGIICPCSHRQTFERSDQAAASPVSWARLTARPGTMVEMACL